MLGVLVRRGVPADLVAGVLAVVLAGKGVAEMVDPTAEDELLPLAQSLNAGIMVRMPLARGLLSGNVNDMLSAAKARKELGWRPMYPLEEGLRETIDWYRSNLE